MGSIKVKNMKRILVDGMCDKEGGVEHFIYRLYHILKEDWQVDFITINTWIPFEEEFLANGSKIHRITPRYKSVKQYKKDINKVFEDTKYDVLWFNKMSLSSVECLKAAKRNHVDKIICHSHGSSNMGSAFTLMMHKLNRLFVGRYVDCKMACSAKAAHWFYGKNIQDVELIPNSIDLDEFTPSKEIREKKRKELRVDDQLVICHIGRFSREKNHTFLIDIFKELSSRQDAVLLLCGEGDLKEEIEEKVKALNLEDKVSFLGMRRDISEILQAVDVLILPSLHEGLPITLVEAQAAGVPCVVSDTVSKEAKLTDLVSFVSLEAPVEDWTDQILKYKGYCKESHKTELEEKGFGIDQLKKKVDSILMD